MADSYLSSPVPVLAGVEYTVSYRTNDNYVATSGYFSATNEVTFDGRDDNAFGDALGIIKTHRRLAALYQYGTGYHASSSYAASNYWVDVGFSPARAEAAVRRYSRLQSRSPYQRA